MLLCFLRRPTPLVYRVPWNSPGVTAPKLFSPTSVAGYAGPSFLTDHSMCACAVRGVRVCIHTHTTHITISQCTSHTRTAHCCLYVHIYTDIYIHICIHIHTYIHTYIPQSSTAYDTCCTASTSDAPSRTGEKYPTYNAHYDGNTGETLTAFGSLSQLSYRLR